MGKLTFTEIEIEGFGSILKPLRYNWDTPGLVILRGNNGNGKSTVLSSFSWVLFGKSLKEGNTEVNTWEHLRDKDYKGTKVSQKFIVNNTRYKVIRHKNYTEKTLEVKGKDRLILLKDGKDISEKRKPTTQKKIESLIGFNYLKLKNSFVFGQRLTRVMQENGTEQKRIFEEIFYQDFLKIIKDRAEDERTKIRDKYSLWDKKYIELSSSYKSKKEQKQSCKSLIKEQEKIKQQGTKDTKKEIKRLENRIIKNTSSLKEIKSILKSLSDAENYNKKIKDKTEPLEKKLFMGEMNIDSLAHKIQVKDNEIGALVRKLKTTTKADECDKCGKVLKGDYKRFIANLRNDVSNLKRDKKSLDKALKVNKEKLSEVKLSISSKKKKLINEDKIKERKSKLEKSLGTEDKIIYAIKEDENKIKELRDNMGKKDVAIKPLKKQLKTLKEGLKKIKPLFKEAKESIKYWEKELDIYDWILKDPLSNKGIKSYLFQKSIQLINKRLEKYEYYLGFSIRFGIDLESANKSFYSEIFKDEHLIFYEELSGGEKQLVDVAIAFSIYDVVNKNLDVNVLIMDEVFENLDNSNIEILTEILKDKSHKKSIHLITHKSNFNPSNSRIISFKKIKGVTKMEF